MKHTYKLILLFTGLVSMFSALFIVQGFAESPNKIKLVFMNPFAPSSYYSPFWSAQRRFWPEENIEGEVLDSRGTAAVVMAVASGSAQAGYASVMEVIKGIHKGMPIKVIAIGSQNDGTMFFTIKGSGISTLKDIEGKKVGQIPFGDVTPIVKATLKKQGVDVNKVTWINVTPGEETKLVLARTIDGAMGKVGFQDLSLYCLGYESICFPVSQYGFDSYEFGIVINSNWEKQIGYEGMVRFLRGIAKGFLLRKTNVAQTVDDMIYYRNMEATFVKRRLAEFIGFLPRMMSADIEKYGWGVITEEKMNKTQDALFEIGFIDKKDNVRKYYDDQYLKDVSIQKIAMEFAKAPIDPKAESYRKACREK